MKQDDSVVTPAEGMETAALATPEEEMKQEEALAEVSAEGGDNVAPAQPAEENQAA